MPLVRVRLLSFLIISWCIKLDIVLYETFIIYIRFRPLSLDVPKPLFPVAGIPILQHHIEACAR